MTIVKTNEYFTPLDLGLDCKVWIQDKNSNQVRQTNKAHCLLALVDAINHARSRYPKTTFMMTQPLGVGDTPTLSTSDPLYIFRYVDNVSNAESYNIRGLAYPNTTSSNSQYSNRQGWGGSVVTSGVNNSFVTSPTYPENLYYFNIVVYRGAVTSAVVDEGISAFSSFGLIDVVFQDFSYDFIDTSTATNITGCTSISRQGQYVFSNQLENIRSKFRDVRITNLPMEFCWCARANAGSFSSPGSAGSSAVGIRVDSATYVNVVDQTITSRTATSPGASSRAQYAGTGKYNTTDGKKVPVRVWVYCKHTGANAGTIRFEGPTGIASNYIELTSTGVVGWVGASTDLVYLDASIADTDTGTTRNKIDVLAKAGAGSQLYIWAYYGQRVG